jgi:ribonuclease BN (tRNA processing enzyme)
VKKLSDTDSSYIKFLGTAGARFVVAKQLRASGGVYISAHGQRLILDPGPGTIVRCASSRPPVDVSQLDALVLTHAHIDHSNDANILIDAMSYGGMREKGVLFAPRECIEGENAVILKYLRSYLERIEVLEASREYRLGELRFSTSVRHQHSAETYGIKFFLDGRQVAFLVDTKFFPGLIESYRGSDILVINVVRNTPFDNNEILHLTLEDAQKIIAGIKPRRSILTHFGTQMIKAKPWELAAALSAAVGREVIAASDGLRIDLKEDMHD